MNYEITEQWQELSSIMGENYDNSKIYRIHSNVASPSKLCITEVENPTSSINGRIYPEYSDIYIDSGSNPKVKVKYAYNSQMGYDIEITEVEL